MKARSKQRLTVIKPECTISSFRVRAALHLLEMQFNSVEVSLSAIAKEVGLTSAYLNRILSFKTGQGFRKHLKSLRMARAVELLGDISLSVKEIASAVGYRYSSGFDRDFKIWFGMTPFEFRAGLKQSFVDSPAKRPDFAPHSVRLPQC